MDKEIKHDEEKLDLFSQAIYKSTIESYTKNLDYKKQVDRIKMIIKEYVKGLE
jgi:hypothetical protein